MPKSLAAHRPPAIPVMGAAKRGAKQKLRKAADRLRQVSVVHHEQGNAQGQSMCSTAVSGVKHTRRGCQRNAVRRGAGCQAGSTPGQAARRTAPDAVLEVRQARQQAAVLACAAAS